MSQDLESLKDWIGRTEEVEDRVTQFQIHGLRALFDDATVPQEGDPCGPMDHWCFFGPRVPKSQIGADGHPQRGGFMPPVPLPRRMFGGCRATHHQPFIIGEKVRRKNTISDVGDQAGSHRYARDLHRKGGIQRRERPCHYRNAGHHLSR